MRKLKKAKVLELVEQKLADFELLTVFKLQSTSTVTFLFQNTYIIHKEIYILSLCVFGSGLPGYGICIYKCSLFRMELQTSKYAASVQKLLKKYKGVWKQGKELVESVANRKMDNPTEEFDKTLNKKLANLLELAESANSIGLTLKESNSQKERDSNVS